MADNFTTSILTVLMCLGPILLPVAAIGGVWGFGRWMRRGAEVVIPMDGATFVKMRDQTVRIRPARVRSIVALAVLLVFEVGLVAAAIAMIGSVIGGRITRDAALRSAFIIPVIIVFLGAAIRLLLQSLRAKAITIDPTSRMVTAGAGRAAQTTPFSALRGLAVGFDPTVTMTRNSVELIPLEFVLSSGERMTIGSLSGSAKRTQEHALEMARIIRDTMTVPGSAPFAALLTNGQEVV